MDRTSTKGAAPVGIALCAVLGCYVPGSPVDEDYTSSTGIGDLGAFSADGPAGSTTFGQNLVITPKTVGTGGSGSDGTAEVGSVGSVSGNDDDTVAGEGTSVGTGGGTTGGVGDLDTGDLDCTDKVPWPACKLWRVPERDFWYGAGCKFSGILFLPTNVILENRQLVCEIRDVGSQQPNSLENAWLVQNTYKGSMWRRDAAGDCIEHSSEDLLAEYPFHYQLNFNRLEDWEIEDLTEFGCAQ